MEFDVFAIGGSDPAGYAMTPRAGGTAAGDVFDIAGTDPATLLSPRIAAAPQSPIAATPSVIAGATADCCLMNLPLAEYHALHEVVSCGMAKQLLRSPAHLHALLRSPRTETPAQRLDNAFHCGVLEPQRFAREYVVYPGPRKGSAWQAFQDLHGGQTILTTAEFRTVTGMREAIRQFDALPLQAIIGHGRAEGSIFWRDEATGVRCRIRPDLLQVPSPRLCLELKSIDDARPDNFLRQIARQHDDLQAAMTLEGCRRFCGDAVYADGGYRRFPLRTGARGRYSNSLIFAFSALATRHRISNEGLMTPRSSWLT